MRKRRTVTKRNGPEGRRKRKEEGEKEADREV
jgi:hypothetical protein